MGIAPYKTFIFDGESSIDYGVYLTGEGVFNAPERAVEMITIPGRNGAFALDQGRFENIEITYKAGMVDVNESNFADKMSAFRNWLCSKVGYCRLEDDYNPNEFRMAVFKNGIEVEHDFLIAGEFEITFECKPQRWLTSGETQQAITSGGTITNPTPFDSLPLLAVKGYGDIDLDGYELTVNNSLYGDFYVVDGDAWTTTKVYDIDIDTVNTSDTVDLSGTFVCRLMATGMPFGETITDSNTSFSSAWSGWQIISYPVFGLSSQLTTSFNTSITIGTNKTVTNTATLTANILPSDTVTFTATQTIQYDKTASTVTVTETVTATTSGSNTVIADSESGTMTMLAHSTASALGNPTYIDCDLGECYRYLSNGNLMTLNNVVEFGSDLPVLSSGAHTITFDNTVTELKIAPRWWKL